MKLSARLYLLRQRLCSMRGHRWVPSGVAELVDGWAHSTSERCERCERVQLIVSPRSRP